jgi:mRNA-degrading endonuclease RelE of RelBE toxin-antitoxin system
LPWKITLKESVIEDLRWLGRREGRLVLKAAAACLATDPLAESRNLKRLRPNPVAERELRLHGKYRVLFNVDTRKKVVTIILVGEKRGESLVVRGEEFAAHHEGDSSE